MTSDLNPDDFESAMGITRRQVPAEQIQKFESYVAEIFSAFGMDLHTPSTEETPQRFIKALFDEALRDREPTPENASWTTPEEIAAAIMYLCSDEARMTTGARIPLYGA